MTNKVVVGFSGNPEFTGILGDAAPLLPWCMLRGSSIAVPGFSAGPNLVNPLEEELAMVRIENGHFHIIDQRLTRLGDEVRPCFCCGADAQVYQDRAGIKWRVCQNEPCDSTYPDALSAEEPGLINLVQQRKLFLKTTAPAVFGLMVGAGAAAFGQPPLQIFFRKEVRRMNRKKRIVIIGGGTGLTHLLSGLVKLGGRERFAITSIVSIADSGGSTGALREVWGVLPPGDIRQSLVALSTKPWAVEFVHHRFTASNGKLHDHTSGNLLFTALGLYTGDDLVALKAMEELLDCQGAVLPVSLNRQVKLIAQTTRGIINGEGLIDAWIYGPQKAKGRQWILDVYLKPRPRILPQAARAIQRADLVVIGPGSFYTSLMAVLSVQGMRQALAGTRLAYVVNITTHPKETPEWPASRFVLELERRIGRKVDFVLCNSGVSRRLRERYGRERSSTVRLNLLSHWEGRRVITANFVPQGVVFARHDPFRLASVIAGLVEGQEQE